MSVLDYKFNTFVANYLYDADGECTVKSSGKGEQIYVNSEFSGGVTNTAKFSLYVSPYLVASQGGKYTKHIYIGSQRIVGKLGDLASYGADPRRIPYAGTEADGVSGLIIFIDPDGKAVKPVGNFAMTTILNTLPKDALPYVVVNDNGYLDVNLMQQYKGNSENFNSLRLMAESNYTITVTALQEVSYISKGETQIEKFNPVIIEDDFKDVDFTSPIGNITGETGNLGVTYMPTNGGPGKADAENSSSIHININPSLSPIGAAETFSHEGYGHAFIYVQSGGDRSKAIHHFEGNRDTNSLLVNLSISARKETVSNMNQ